VPAGAAVFDEFEGTRLETSSGLRFNDRNPANRFGRPVPVPFSNVARRAAVVLVAVTMLGHSVGGPRATPLQQGVDEAGLETISVGVFDNSGASIQGLTAADFLVREDGEEREIAFVEARAGAPLDVALVLDLSGSMELSTRRQPSLDFLHALSPQRDCVLLMRFRGTASDSIWGRSNDPALAAAIEESRAGGGTFLYAALVEVFRQLFPSAADVGSNLADADCPSSTTGPRGAPWSPRRMAVVAFTDGGDFSSGQDIHQLEMSIHATGVPIFQVDFGAMSVRQRTPSALFPTSRDFRKLVNSSGGDTFRSGPEAYQRLLARLRDSYLVRYRVAATGREPPLFEYTRHEIEVEIPGRRATAEHRPVVYRPAFDAIRARSELDEGIRQLQSRQLEAALASFARSIDAHPYLAAPHAYRARVQLSTEGVERALASALRAVELEPANGQHHMLVSELASIAERDELAWEHAIRGAQSGGAVAEALENLAASAPPPADLAERLEAPRIVVLAAPPSQPDLIVRAALPKAIRSIQWALSQSAQVALVADLGISQYVVWVAERTLSDKLPRRFKGRVLLADRAGRSLYEHDFTLGDLDGPASNADDLLQQIAEIVEKVSARPVERRAWPWSSPFLSSNAPGCVASGWSRRACSGI